MINNSQDSLKNITDGDKKVKGLTPKQRWEKIKNFKFPPRFFELICQKNHWDMSFASEAVEEYQKFMYLATYSKVTPSLIIDEVWHLHIQWTSLYAEFCQDIFSNDFCHHSPEFIPPKNGVSSFHDQYYETLKRYYWEFDCHPPKNIWSYALNKGVKLKLDGRVIPLSAEPLGKTFRMLLSPAFLGAVIKARIKKSQSSNLILNEDIEEAKILQWKFPQGFETRLAKEQGWSKKFALEAMSEYLRFHVLKLRGVESISPVLEKVWLLHLLATKNYRDFSHSIGKKIISYTPNTAKSLSWSNLLSEYQKIFLNLPPRAIWKI